MNFDAELSTFQKIANGEDTETQLITVHVSSGIGKTRLLQEYKAIAKQHNLEVIEFSLGPQLTIEKCLDELIHYIGPTCFKNYRMFRRGQNGENESRVKNETWYTELTWEFFSDFEQLDQIRVTPLSSPYVGNRISSINRQDYQRRSAENRSIKDRFDVFLCHNSEDKLEVKKIGNQLKDYGLQPWLDEWELRPGVPWQRSLEENIEKIDSSAVFVGASGIGPWQQLELEAFLRELVKRECPVIPVILKETANLPKLPLFLEGLTWVDFRQNAPDLLERLIWGITGERRSSPVPSDQINRLILFFDAYEKADQAFKQWICNSFLRSLRQKPIVVVIAGQDEVECTSTTWYEQRHFKLDGVSVDWYRYYAETCGVELSADEINLLHEVLKGRPKDFVDFIQSKSTVGAAG